MDDNNLELEHGNIIKMPSFHFIDNIKTFNNSFSLYPENHPPSNHLNLNSVYDKPTIYYWELGSD